MNFPDSIWTHVPWWAGVALLAVGGGLWLLSKLSGAYKGVEEFCAKFIPFLGRRWQTKAEQQALAEKNVRDAKELVAKAERLEANRVDAELADLRRQVSFLTRQLGELRDRDEMYWAWILTDQEWHRREEFRAIAEQRVLDPHVSFMQFRDSWIAAHPNREERPF